MSFAMRYALCSLPNGSTNKIAARKKPWVKRLQDFIAGFLDEQLSLVPQKKTILCTSDIIESAFGKYKSYINNNPMVGITDLSLVIAAFTSDLNAEMIKKAMEEVKVNDIKNWNKINIGQTNFQKRQQVLKKVG